MKHTILFLAANPSRTDRLALDQEARSIQVELERSRWRDCFEFVTRWAAEPLDLIRELRKLRPTVVHFSGHGGPDGAPDRDRHVAHRDLGVSASSPEAAACPGLYFHGPDGSPCMVSAAALRDAFGAAGSSVRLAVLNACYSEAAAHALLAHVDCVVGMTGSIRDDAARSFAVGFYGGLGERESVDAAYKGGCAAIGLDGLPDGDRPRLQARQAVDPGAVVLADLRPNTPDTPRPRVAERRVAPSALATERPQVSIGRDAIGNVITTGTKNTVKAHVTAPMHETPLVDPAMVDMAKELGALRTLLLGLESEHAKKIGRALDDADEEAGKKTDANKEELGRALDRALTYAKSATAFATAATKLAPHLRAAVAWLGSQWTALLSHLV